jgi:hypothetical protein
MAIGEVLARYYRHPSMVDQAVKAGGGWEQIGAARGTSAEQARQDYREWADGQHNLVLGEDKHDVAEAVLVEPSGGREHVHDLAALATRLLRDSQPDWLT